MNLPQSVLYTTSSRLGGYGLDLQAFEAVRGVHRANILGRVVCYQNRQTEIPAARVRSLRWHPVRLLSGLGSKYYYGAKKHYLDWIGAREIASGKYDFFHGWSGESLRTLREARKRGIPGIIEIPTWHRNKGKDKPSRLTKSERERAATRGLQGALNRLLISRQYQLEEYDLASLILVYSECARDTFLAAGVAPEKLFYIPLATDIERFTPGEPPGIFRAVYVGAMIKRKGVHQLLEAWHRLNLEDAELVLVGAVHDEIKPYLEKFRGPTVRVAGFAPKPEDFYRAATVHVFPSTCEGSAKVTYDAAACGLPQITTRESGDVVVDGLNGLVVPVNDLDALAAAIQRLYRDRELTAKFGKAARQRVVENFTWDHFRTRLLEAYHLANSRRTAA
jgi:glycosyltransferase involved in cell wall biosynthesis